MAGTTGIAWTDGTVNFWIGCTHVGPGCGEMINGKQVGCYAEVFANRKFNIQFGPGERRHKTKAGYENPLRWQSKHDVARATGVPATMKQNHQIVPVPRWVFCNSLSDFFDNEIDPAWRAEAWEVVRACPDLRWQIVTKRIGNAQKMLPADWDGGRNYPHVGIIATMVTPEEVARDIDKLRSLKSDSGVKWIGLSIEPQLARIRLSGYASGLDWIITGGESKQGDHAARAYDMAWAEDLIEEGAIFRVPVFVKQMGDNPLMNGKPVRGLKAGGKDPALWPEALRVQQMPRIYGDQ